MKKLLFSLFLILGMALQAQELMATVQVNSSQIGGTNTQVFRTLEKSLRDFINNTSWTGKRLQNFEKIKCNISIVVSERPSQNSFRGSIIVQSTRPVFGTQYDSPMLNINDTNFGFDYTENENLIFNERQFSGKNLIDVVSFYIYLILGYDADSFQSRSGQPYFEKAMRISQNAQGQNFVGWSSVEGPRTRGSLITRLLNEESKVLRSVNYGYHRLGLDNLAKQEQSAKRMIAEQLLSLRTYENSFQMNYPFNLFIEAKKNEIFQIFNNGNNGAINLTELRALMNTFSPKDSETYWNKWK